MNYNDFQPERPADINNSGPCGTLQRLIYQVTRCSTTEQWRSANNLAHNLLKAAADDKIHDTEMTLLLNAIAATTETVIRMREALWDSSTALERTADKLREEL